MQSNSWQGPGIGEVNSHILYRFRMRINDKPVFDRAPGQDNMFLFELTSYSVSMKTEDMRYKCLSNLLEKKDIDLNMVDKNGRQPIWYALHAHNPTMVRQLMQDARIKFADRDRFGDPLIFAITKIVDFNPSYRMEAEMVEVLEELFSNAIDKGINLFFPLSHDKNTLSSHFKKVGFSDRNATFLKMFLKKKNEFRKKHMPRSLFDSRASDREYVKEKASGEGKRSRESIKVDSPVFNDCFVKARREGDSDVLESDKKKVKETVQIEETQDSPRIKVGAL